MLNVSLHDMAILRMKGVLEDVYYFCLHEDTFSKGLKDYEQVLSTLPFCQRPPIMKTMINPQQHLVSDILSPEVKREPTRAGFGCGLVEAGRRDANVVALCADLTESTRMIEFAEAFPDRFVEIGIGEQNLVTVGAGMALAGKIPFVSSYAAFSPGRNWEQIRTTICLMKPMSKSSARTPAYRSAPTARRTRCSKTSPSCGSARHDRGGAGRRR
jgi:hypothetical protein